MHETFNRAAVYRTRSKRRRGSAQDKYPSRAVKVIVPYAPGGATDIVARIVGDEFQKITGQGFVVLNKPGAFGMLAIDEMVKAAPDGYTVMVGNVSTNAITPIIYAKKMNLDYAKSVVAVTNLIDVPAFLLVTTANDFPVKTVKELVDYAKKNPGKMRYGTVGIGSYPHYDMAYFAKKAGDLDLVGAAEQERRFRRDPGPAARRCAGRVPQRRVGGAGKYRPANFRALAVVNHTRLTEYPNVPTMKEVGFADVGTIAWNGMFAPAATPKPVLEALFAAVTKALNSPEAEEKLKKQNFNVVPSKSVDDAQKWLAGEMKHWETITSAVKIEMTQ